MIQISYSRFGGVEKVGGSSTFFFFRDRWLGCRCFASQTGRVSVEGRCVGSSGRHPDDSWAREAGQNRRGTLAALAGMVADGVYGDIPEELRAVIEPIVADHGLELVDVVCREGRVPWSVRVVLDTPAGDGRVAVERCVAVSREVGAHLDAADLIRVAYELEVSSPGLDRVLAREKDFARALGRTVKLETRRALDGRHRFRGQLARWEAGVATLEVEGRAIAIPFAEISRAHMVYVFSREDFAARCDAGA